MQAAILILAAFLSSLVFGWFMTSLLDILALPLMNAGLIARKKFDLEEHDEKDAWLFTLLVSVTRVPVILIAAWSFFFYLMALFVDASALRLILSVSLNTFWIIFVMREGAVFLGSFLLGPSMKEVMQSLRG